MEGDDLVEAVPMPDGLIAWVQAFIDRHHVDQPFVKRKRKRRSAGTEGPGMTCRPPARASEALMADRDRPTRGRAMRMRDSCAAGRGARRGAEPRRPPRPRTASAAASPPRHPYGAETEPAPRRASAGRPQTCRTSKAWTRARTSRCSCAPAYRRTCARSPCASCGGPIRSLQARRDGGVRRGLHHPVVAEGRHQDRLPDRSRIRERARKARAGQGRAHAAGAAGRRAGTGARAGDRPTVTGAARRGAAQPPNRLPRDRPAPQHGTRGAGPAARAGLPTRRAPPPAAAAADHGRSADLPDFRETCDGVPRGSRELELELNRGAARRGVREIRAAGMLAAGGV